jgi:hypothetical protein
MDNCRAHLKANMVRLLMENNVKVITFSPHTSDIFQLLDLVFFSAFKRAKRSIPRNSGLPLMQYYMLRMCKGHEAGATGSTVRVKFSTGNARETSDRMHVRFSERRSHSRGRGRNRLIRSG